MRITLKQKLIGVALAVAASVLLLSGYLLS